MRLFKSLTLTITLLSTITFIAQAKINVVASVKPVHSLVAAVMEGIGAPVLIVKGAASPHTYALKPSQAEQIEKADLVFWMGHSLETFLEKPLESLASKAMVVELMDSHGLKKLEMREGGGFDEHDHDDHDEGGHKEHDEDGHKEHEDHSEEEHDNHAEESHDDHGHGKFDVHVWLDPENAKVMANEIMEALKKVDPENAKKYETNTKKVVANLNRLVAEVSAKMTTLKGKGFVVFHDAYQYFEERFSLKAVGSITVSPEVVPGVKRIKELKTKIKELNAICVFSEPQFKPKLVSTVVEGTKAKTGVLDPLGAAIQNGPKLYFILIRDMANSLNKCLSNKA
jgi:zinc transport system substrate-binding protein